VGSAFGAPGIAPTWTSSAKDLVSTALGPGRIWVTVGFGIVNEVYWPATGSPQIRDLGFIVAGPEDWFEVKRVNRYRISTPRPDVPLPRIVHEGPGYRLTLEVLPAALRDVLLVVYRLEGEQLRLYPLLAPHLEGSGAGNSAWVDDALFASRGAHALCLLADGGFERASAGYVGFSDGWQDFARNGRMTWEFEQASDGNVALMGELRRAEGTLALGFAESPAGARTLAASALAEGYEPIRDRFLRGWRRWARALHLPPAAPELRRQARLSAAVLKIHEDRTYPGAIVASLSIPWGQRSDDPGGYHLVWARDAVEAGLALLAAGDRASASRTLAYLAATQAADGHWSQNFYPDGRRYWTGVQLDEVGFPILLAAKLRELGEPERPLIGQMVRRAAAYLARCGPLSPQDRWEENAGASPFTLAVEVAALVAAAAWLEGAEREYALQLADSWNERIEEWTYVEHTDLAAAHDVRGYYVRIGPPPGAGGLRGCVEVANRGGETVPATALVGLDFLYLTRLGLRAGDDQRISDTLRVADAVLRVDTPRGPAFHRYEQDGYGEHADGSPFDGTGIGRAWPLLTGERGHAALVAGEDPTAYLEAMAHLTGPGGLLPEQVWDTEPIPERLLFPGEPTGSAMPLVWAHAEFLKLLLAATAGRPVEQLDVVIERYGGVRPRAATWFWRDEAPVQRLPPGRALVVEAAEPFVLHFGFDGWQEVAERASAATGLGMHGVRLDAEELAPRSRLDFTRRWSVGERWEGTDHTLELQPAGSAA
jgi:glucoamylase